MPERGDLLLVPFPFSDLSAAKRRPVLALTAADRHGDFIELPVTSRPQTEHGLPGADLRLKLGAHVAALRVGLLGEQEQAAPRLASTAPPPPNNAC